MRIGFFTDSYLPRADGIANNVEAYRAGLEELGNEVFVFCPKRPEPFSEPNKRIYRFPSIKSLAYENYRDTFPFTPKHISYIRSLKLDVVHTFTPAQIGILGAYIARKDKIPLVTTCMVDFDLVKEYPFLGCVCILGLVTMSILNHRFLSLSELGSLLKPRFPITSWLQKMVMVGTTFYNDQCDLITVPSLKIKHEIEPYIKKKTVLIPLSTDLSLVPEKSNGREIRSKYKLSENITLFVSSSRLVKEKRIDFLIRSYSHLSSEDQAKSALVIVGSGPEINSLKKLVGELGLTEKVVFTGLLSHKQVLEIVSACDIFVHSSLRESQGLVLNEAAACGKPLIMIDRDVNTVLQAGENGLFSENTITDFCKKMKTLLNDKELCVKFGKKSRKLAKNTGHIKVAHMLESEYKQLIYQFAPPDRKYQNLLHQPHYGRLVSIPE